MKVYIRTYGCQMNERDSENIAACFIERGWEITDDETLADAAVVNTCSVREQAEQKAVGKLGRLIGLRKQTGGVFPVVGVVGCMAQNLGAKIVAALPNIDFVLGARKTHLVAETAEKILGERKRGIGHPALPKGEKRTAKTSAAYVDISDDETSHLKIDKHLPEMGTKNVCAYVSIMQGCQMNCSYCIVPKTRGVQRSRPAEDVLAEVRALAERGVKEITLLGQVVNAFGRENGPHEFPNLLRSINSVSGIRRIRFTSPHPSYFTDELIDLYASLEKLCEYVHLPLQSGSDRILKAMNRPYRAERFLEIVKKLRRRAPNMSISTDIIVGYPGETDADFAETRKVFADSAFDMAFIFKYSPRLGTKSAEIADDISEGEKEARNQTLLGDLAKFSSNYNNALVGTEQEILAEGSAKRGESMMMGRTRTHRKTLFKASPEDAGKILRVKIKSATVTALLGEVM